MLVPPPGGLAPPPTGNPRSAPGISVGSRISRGGGAKLGGGGGHQRTVLPNFPKNCMKLKEFGPP